MPDYRHLLAMTDENGLLQFSIKTNPDPGSGYTLDDNARALMVSLHMDDSKYDYQKLFLDYLEKSKQTNKTWSNFLLNGCYSSQFDSEDSIGRALMACSAATQSPRQEISEKAGQLLIDGIATARGFSSPRAVANTLIALCKARVPEINSVRPELINRLSRHLLDLYAQTKSKNWRWFENYLTYCNAILPQSLFCVYSFNGNRECLNAAYDTLGFLNDILFSQGYLNIIGNQGWSFRNRPTACYDQQPIDAASIAFACWEAYNVSGKNEYKELITLAHNWYHGENINKLSLYDTITGGCYDALTKDGVNLNQGAESTLSLIFMTLLANGNLGPDFQIIKHPANAVTNR
ncbi:MAG: hypothetical protein AB7E34_10475 [Acidaminococcaceae bacterium]